MNVFKNKLNALLLVFFIASVLFVMYEIIFNSDGRKEEVKNGKSNYTKEEVEIYSTDEYLVFDYDVFYTIENISKQIISALSEGKYKTLYKVLSSELAGDISKEQYASVFSEFYISNFSDVKNEDSNTIESYENSKNLVCAYTIANNTYIASVKNNHGGVTRIGLKLNDDSTYKIVYFEM